MYSACQGALAEGDGRSSWSAPAMDDGRSVWGSRAAAASRGCLCGSCDNRLEPPRTARVCTAASLRCRYWLIRTRAVHSGEHWSVPLTTNLELLVVIEFITAEGALIPPGGYLAPSLPPSLPPPPSLAPSLSPSLQPSSCPALGSAQARGQQNQLRIARLSVIPLSVPVCCTKPMASMLLAD